MTRRLAPALLLLLVACSGDEPTRTRQNTYLNGNTPATVLEDFRRSWSNQDIEHYATLFSDDYAFYFDPLTLSENPTLPEFWGKAEEVENVGQLFASEEITDIPTLCAGIRSRSRARGGSRARALAAHHGHRRKTRDRHKASAWRKRRNDSPDRRPNSTFLLSKRKDRSRYARFISHI
jgi:hypothetical protein